MDLTRAKLSLLVTFDAVARNRSVTRAAEELSVSQSALSNALMKLRDMFGDPLLVRSRGGMVLTPRAKSLVRPVRSILASTSSLLRPATFDPRTCDRTCRVGLTDCAMAVVGMAALVRLRKQAPSMRIMVDVGDRNSERSVQNGTLDIAIRYADHVPATRHSDLLFEDRFVGAIHASHPLAAQCRSGEPVTAEQYAGLPHVHTVLRGLKDDHVGNAVTKAGLSRPVPYVGNSFLANLPLLMVGPLVATVPSMVGMAARHMGFDVVTFELPFQVRPLAYRMYWSERNEGDAANQWVRQVYRDVSPRAS